MQFKKQIALFLLIFSCCSSLPQSDHNPEIIRLRKDLVRWQVRDQTFCKIRNCTALVTLCSGLCMAFGCSLESLFTVTHKSQHHYMLNRRTIKYPGIVATGLLVGLVALPVFTLSAPTTFISIILVLYSKYTVAEIKAMLHSLGYDIDENELQEIVEHVKSDDQTKEIA